MIAVLGHGEAGSAFAADLHAGGARVRVYDPVVAPPDHLERADSEGAAAAGADLVLSVNSSSAAVDALRAALPRLGEGTVWADLNTAAPAVKRQLADIAETAHVGFADVAIMAPVPGKGITVPMLVSGDSADQVERILADFGTPIRVQPGPPGAAAERKLLRSVFFKGMSAAVMEALAAARAAKCEPWLRENIEAELATAGPDIVERLVTGTLKHARRRSDEMAAATEMLESLGVEPHVARASRESLRDLIE